MTFYECSRCGNRFSDVTDLVSVIVARLVEYRHLTGAKTYSREERKEWNCKTCLATYRGVKYATPSLIA